MNIHLSIDNQLLRTAQKISGFKTKKETVNQALREFIARRKQAGIVKLFGTINYDADYDYKKLRWSR